MGKAGNNQKGQKIVDGVNPNKKGALSAARMKKLKQDALLAKQKEAMDAVNQMKTIAGSMGISPDDLPTPEVPDRSALSTPNDQDDSDDSKSAYQMLQDMRWVYRNVKGRDKLKKLMADDKQFQFLVKELMKIETSLMAAKVRSQGNREGNVNGFFVILKGLEDDKAVIEQLSKQRKESPAIDLQQVSHAMNPEATFEFEEEKQPEVEGPAGW